jgi:hypothetical protein
MNIEEVKEEIFKMQTLERETRIKYSLIEKDFQKNYKPIEDRLTEFVREFRYRHEIQWINNFVKEKTDDIIRRFGFCPEKELENIKGEAIMSYPYHTFNCHSEGVEYTIRCSDGDSYGDFDWEEIEEIMK